MSCRALMVVLLLATSFASRPGIASAQDAEPTSDEAAAAALFRRAVSLGQEERWAEAHELFRRSYALVERPATLFNLAYSLFRVGRFRESVALFDEYTGGIEGTADRRRSDAMRLRADAASLLAEVTLDVSPPDAAVYVDGAVALAVGSERTLVLDPGSHRVVARLDGFDEASFEVLATAGERSRRSVHLVSALGEASVSGPVVGARPPADRDLAEEPLFWLAVGGGVVLVGGAIALGVTLGTAGAPAEYGGTSGVVIEALRF